MPVHEMGKKYEYIFLFQSLRADLPFEGQIDKIQIMTTFKIFLAKQHFNLLLLLLPPL
jgi:hypothetical protein